MIIFKIREGYWKNMFFQKFSKQIFSTNKKYFLTVFFNRKSFPLKFQIRPLYSKIRPVYSKIRSITVLYFTYFHLYLFVWTVPPRLDEIIIFMDF